MTLIHVHSIDYDHPDVSLKAPHPEGCSAVLVLESSNNVVLTLIDEATVVHATVLSRLIIIVQELNGLGCINSSLHTIVLSITSRSKELLGVRIAYDLYGVAALTLLEF
jgi:hypothetical protein